MNRRGEAVFPARRIGPARGTSIRTRITGAGVTGPGNTGTCRSSMGLGRARVRMRQPLRSAPAGSGRRPTLRSPAREVRVLRDDELHDLVLMRRRPVAPDGLVNDPDEVVPPRLALALLSPTHRPRTIRHHTCHRVGHLDRDRAGSAGQSGCRPMKSRMPAIISLIAAGVWFLNSALA